ncbi:MAG: hypothetical protein JRG91_13205 [Deltaproteobacteria bacterium]|nr:hypothetical protein [Deltaproteobacteria bacterium]
MTPAVVMHLTWGAVRSLALGAWRVGRGRDAFVAAFAPEGLTPFDEQGRGVAVMMGGCLGCGACEDLARSPRAVLEAVRGLDHLEDVEDRVRALAGLLPEEIQKLERACPASIPFGRISSALGRMLDRSSNLD